MAQSKDDKKANKRIKRPMAKVQKDDDKGYQIIGKTSKKNESLKDSDTYDRNNYSE